MTQPLLDITSTNSKLFLTVEDLYPNAVQLQNFSTDQAISVDEQEIAQVRMGVDGGLAAGYVPNPYVITISFEAGSASLDVMWDIMQAMRNNNRIYSTTLMAQIESIGKVFEWSNGTLTSGTVIPGIKKTLDATSFKFSFARLNQSSI